MFEQIHPVLPCQDVASAIEFHVEIQGQGRVSQQHFSPHVAVTRDGSVLGWVHVCEKSL